jgi:hypothetical protein
VYIRHTSKYHLPVAQPPSVISPSTNQTERSNAPRVSQKNRVQAMSIGVGEEQAR